MNHLPTKIPKGPAVALALTSSITLYAIFYSHYSQVSEKEVMRAGVARDKECSLMMSDWARNETSTRMVLKNISNYLISPFNKVIGDVLLLIYKKYLRL